jgi:hypothetical protein
MRVDSRAHLAASLVTLATRSRDQELSLAGPSPPVLLAVVLADRVGYVVRVGVGTDRRAVGKVTAVMHSVSQQCHQFSHTKVRVSFCVIDKFIGE